MIARVFGSIIRALVVAFIIIVPSTLVTQGASQAQLFTFTFAALAAGIIFVEYLVEAPAVIEFRFASPYNRLRIMLFATLALVIAQGMVNQILNSDSGWMAVTAGVSERLMTGWPSPAAVLINAFDLSIDNYNLLLMRVASFTFLMAFFFTFVFGLFIWLGAWPLGQKGFNLWPNMPSFTARAGQKASTKIIQVAILSLTLSITLPYIIPFFVSYGTDNFGLNFNDNNLTIYWVLLLWATIPALALFRAISLMKLAFLAENIRNF